MRSDNLHEIFDREQTGNDNCIETGIPLRWRKKTITAGDMKIVKLYPVRADYTQPRHKLGKKTREAQRNLNRKNVSERFDILFWANFTQEDFFVTLTFDVEPADRNKALENFKYYIKKQKKSSQGNFKYLGCIETQDTDGETVRIHFHVVFSGVDRDAIEKNWIYGSVRIGHISDNFASVQYLTKVFNQAAEGEHHYIRSRNLSMPVPDVKTLDSRYLPDADEIEAIISAPADYADCMYEDYVLTSDPEVWKSSYMPGCYVKISLIRRSCREIAKENQKQGFLEHQTNQILGTCETVKHRQHSDANGQVDI